MSIQGPLLVVYTLASLVLTGGAVLLAVGVRPRRDRLRFAGLSIGFGVFGCGLAALAWLLLGLGAKSFALMLVAQLALLGALVAIARRRAPIRRPSRTPSSATREPRQSTAERWVFRVALLYVVLMSGVHIALGSLTPSVSGDEAEHWGTRAQVLYQAGGFGPEFRAFVSGPPFMLHMDYPWMVPAMRVWTSVAGGEFSWVTARLPLSLCALAAALILGASVRREAGGLWAALAMVGFANGTFYIRSLHEGMADAMVGLAVLIAVDAWLRRVRSGLGSEAWIVALALAYVVCAKNEGSVWVAVFAVGWLASRLRPVQRQVPPAWVFAPALALLLAKAAFNRHFGFEFDMLGTHSDGMRPLERMTALFFERIGIVSEYLAFDVILSPATTQLALAALLVAACLSPVRTWTSTARGPAAALLAFIALLVPVYLGTFAEVTWHLETSAQRLAWQAVPAAGLTLAALLGRSGEVDSTIHHGSHTSR